MPRSRSLTAAALCAVLFAGISGCSGDNNPATAPAPTGSGSGGDEFDRIDRTNPEATALAFIRLYAINDRRMCNLADPVLSDLLNKDGRCGLPTTGPPPQTTLVDRKPCTPPSSSASGYQAEVSPPGAWGQRYAYVSVAYVGTQWVVKRTSAHQQPWPGADPNRVQADGCQMENNYGSSGSGSSRKGS